MTSSYVFLEITIIIARVFIELVFFAIGVSVFSFLNVVIYRLPRHIQFVGGKSMCTSCHHELVSKDLIPIISWVSLKGRCRYCGEKISARYTIVEALGGASAVVCTLLLGINWKALVAFLISGVIVTAVYIIFDKARNYGKV